MDTENIPGYMAELNRAVSSLPVSQLETIAKVLESARDEGKNVYVFGNGDSATNALHISMDLNKGTILPGKKRFRVITFNENVPLMTAWTNDESYEAIFKQQLENFLKPGEVVIGISGSGNSPNVLRAIEYANSTGAITIGLTALGGGKLKSLAKHCIVVDTKSMEIAEDVHFIIGHMVKMFIIGRSHK
ncbi:MAG: SIS domain-containing protein [Candidatus Micrarchaeia archaeon]